MDRCHAGEAVQSNSVDQSDVVDKLEGWWLVNSYYNGGGKY